MQCSPPVSLFSFEPKHIEVTPPVRYTNNLAAICDYSYLSRRLSALGTYRFWRDMRYAVGARINGTCGNWSLAVKTLPGLYQGTAE